MSFLGRLRDDAVFLAGAYRALKMTTPIGKHPTRVFPLVIDELADRYGDAPALIDAATEAGANQINGPGLSASNAEALYRQALAKAVADAGVVKTLGEQGMEPLATQPAEWGKYLASELTVYTKITRDANIKP